MNAFYVVLNLNGNGCSIYVLDATEDDFKAAEQKLGHWVSSKEDVANLGLPVRFEWGATYQIFDMVDLDSFIDAYADGVLEYPCDNEWVCCYED